MPNLTDPEARRQYYPSIAAYAMDRRTAMAQATVAIQAAMEAHQLTPLEWLLVFVDLQKRVLHPATENEWIAEATS